VTSCALRLLVLSWSSNLASSPSRRCPSGVGHSGCVVLPFAIAAQGDLTIPQIQEFLEGIQQLEAAIEQQAKSRRQQWQADFEAHKLRVEKEVLAQQKRFKGDLRGDVLTAEWRHTLYMPFICPVLVPMLLLDEGAWVLPRLCLWW
jgi:hypothetical protein